MQKIEEKSLENTSCVKELEHHFRNDLNPLLLSCRPVGLSINRLYLQLLFYCYCCENYNNSQIFKLFGQSRNSLKTKMKTLSKSKEKKNQKSVYGQVSFLKLWARWFYWQHHGNDLQPPPFLSIKTIKAQPYLFGNLIFAESSFFPQ